MLGTTTTGDPFAYPEADGSKRDRSGEVVAAMKKLGLVLILVASARIASAQTVLARARIGNNIEGMTFVGTGPLASSVVFVDGYQLRSVSAEPCAAGAASRSCSTSRPLPSRDQRARLHFGERKFVLLDFGQPNTGSS